MHDDINTSWRYTKARELTTHRGIDIDGFRRACKNIVNNLKVALDTFENQSNFSISVVLQKQLRDKDYQIINDRQIIDSILDKGYNIDEIKEI